MSHLRIATAQYGIDWLADWSAFEAKLSAQVAEAAGQGAQLLVFPEYAAMELASLFGEAVCKDLVAQLDALQGIVADYLALHRRLADQHQVYLLAGSLPVRQSDGRYRNRAHLIGPDGRIGYQDKLIMTRFENERWGISPGDELRVFDTPLGKLGVAICYDSEFPLLGRRLAEAGADLLLAPSCTDTQAGYNRVRIGCQARALENQCFVVQACTVGDASWSEAVDVNVGTAAVYGPVDVGFPPDGVLAIGEGDRPQWVYAELPLQRARSVRRHGQVLNYRDWDRQADLPAVETLPL